jgi:two-component system, LytTR family, response regulator
MINCIAIDDEPLALELIRKYASETPILRLAETFTDAIAAKGYLRVYPIDLIFLDIQMPDINGIQFFESMKTKPLVVFTTAYSEYAAKGFDLEAVDYLIKPIKFERFVQAILRAEKIMEKTHISSSDEEDYFFLRSDHHSVRINFSDIIYIEGLNDYVKIFLRNNPKPIISLINLKGILERLPREKFMRVHRSYIIPVNLIISVHNQRISLGSATIPIGKTYLKTIHNWLTQH